MDKSGHSPNDKCTAEDYGGDVPAEQDPNNDTQENDSIDSEHPVTVEKSSELETPQSLTKSREHEVSVQTSSSATASSERGDASPKIVQTYGNLSEFSLGDPKDQTERSGNNLSSQTNPSTFATRPRPSLLSVDIAQTYHIPSGPVQDVEVPYVGPVVESGGEYMTERVETLESAMVQQVEHQIPSDLSNSSNYFYLSNSTCTVQQGLTQKTPLQNILDSTQQLIKSDDPTKHVSTYAERSALKMLKRFGFIFIKGRSGTGKSRAGLRLLSEIAREKKCKPVLLSFPQDWNIIPKTGDKYAVMIDDIFGSSNLVQSQVDEWARLFDIIWPSLESGQMHLVITSRPEIFAQCENKMKKYDLMNKIPNITLDEGDFCMRQIEKKKFLKKYCEKRTELSDDEIEEISLIHTSLGFPQCCEFFARSKQAQVKRVCFFHKPHLCLKELLSIMKETDPLGYFVLQLVMLNKGYLKHEFLKRFKAPEEFSVLVNDLSNTSNLPSAPSRGQIKVKAESLCGVLLCHTDNSYQFQHQSIFDVLFLDMAEEYPEACIRICPVSMLVELVRTEEHQTEDHEVVIILTQDNYDVLADRMTEILESECADNIWDHPSLRNDAFLHHLLSKWNDDVTWAIMSRRQSNGDDDDDDNDAAAADDDDEDDDDDIVFNPKPDDDITILSDLWEKNEILTKHVVYKIAYSKKEYKENHLLLFAITHCLSDLVKLLLDRGCIPDKKCFEELCCSELLDNTINERILSMITIERDTFAQERGFSLLIQASLNDNVSAARKLFDFVVGKTKDIAYECLFTLCNKSDGCVAVNVIKALGLFSFDFEQHQLKKLVDVCSSHRFSVSLKLVLEKGVTYSPSEWMTYVHNALSDGSVDCAVELLEMVPYKWELSQRLVAFLYAAINTKIDAGPKMKLLLQYYSDIIVQRYDCNSKSSILNESEEAKGILRSACCKGNAEAVRLLTEKGADVNVQGHTGTTPLHIAVKFSHTDCVEELLKAGADVNVRDESAKPLLLMTNNSQIIKKLVHSGSNVNDVDTDGKTALLTAAKHHDFSVVRFLCTTDSDVNHTDKKGRSVIHMVCQFGDVDMIKYLFERGAKPTLDKDGKSVLHYAAKSQTDAVENLQYLVSVLHVSVHTEDDSGQTALFPAVSSGDVEVLEYLLENGAAPKITDRDGNSLLHEACAWLLQCDLSMVRFLCDVGVDPDLYNKNNMLCLHIAASQYMAETFYDSVLDQCIMFLVQKTHHAHSVSIEGRTLFHLAAMTGYVQCLQELIAKGTDRIYKQCDSDGRTALHLAAKSGKIQCIELLLQKGTVTSINQGDRYGHTPLHCAAWNGNVECVKLLLDKGADRNVKDNYGKKPTPAWWVQHCSAIKDLLKP